MYQSIVFYLGLDSCACLRDHNMFDHATLMRVNATYHEDFSAREEKIKFDRALEKQKRNTVIKANLRAKLKKSIRYDLEQDVDNSKNRETNAGANQKKISKPPNRDSTRPLILLEEEENEEEPIYVNIDTIRDRRRQSKVSTSSLRASEGESSESIDTDHPPGLDSPNTRKRLMEEEPVEVDIDAVRENWQKSVISMKDLSTQGSRQSLQRLSSSDTAGKCSLTSQHSVKIDTPPTQDQRRRSIAQAGQDAGRLFSPRGSLGGAVAKLSEAVADELSSDEGNGLDKIDEGAVEIDKQDEVAYKERGESLEEEAQESAHDVIQYDNQSGMNSASSKSDSEEDRSNAGSEEDKSELSQASVEDASSE